MGFKKATKEQAKLRFTFDGVAGSGKTFSSLVLARAIAGPGGRVGLIDTEHGSASKYADKFDFETLILDEFSIDTYLRSLADAARANFDVLIIDSLSHAWAGKGGALEEVDRMGGNSKFTGGWRTVSPKHNTLVDAMLAHPTHLICTMRKKTEYVLETETKNGKTIQVPRKVGMAPVQREGMEYEFDVIADLDIDGAISIAKTRCDALTPLKNQLQHRDVPRLGEMLKAWLADGVPPAPHAPKPSPPSMTPLDKLIVRINEAQSRADLETVAESLRSIPQADRDALRPAFNRRLAEVTKGAAA